MESSKKANKYYRYQNNYKNKYCTIDYLLNTQFRNMSFMCMCTYIHPSSTGLQSNYITTNSQVAKLVEFHGVAEVRVGVVFRPFSLLLN